MSFSKIVKQEIVNQPMNHDESFAFIMGLFDASMTKTTTHPMIRINSFELNSKIKEILEGLKIKFDIVPSNHSFKILENLPTSNKTINHPGFYFGGVFCGGGSIANPELSMYHLEIQLHAFEKAQKMLAFLQKHELNFSLITRRNQFVLYVKKSEQISNFLRAINAFESLMIFEDQRIKRDLKNQLNRYSNFDVYNQMKLAEASNYFLEQWNFVKKQHLERYFSDNEQAFYELKAQHQFESLAELVSIFNQTTNQSKTKSGLNHYLIKLRNFYEANIGNQGMAQKKDQAK